MKFHLIQNGFKVIFSYKMQSLNNRTNGKAGKGKYVTKNNWKENKVTSLCTEGFLGRFFRT